MNTFNDIKELVTALKREEKLISEMFSKRKTIDYRLSDALELVDHEESRIDLLIQKSAIRENGGLLELDGQFLEFFEHVLYIRTIKVYLQANEVNNAVFSNLKVAFVT